MNSYRLSTSSAPKFDRAHIKERVSELLSGPSNLEVREGSLFIKSLNRPMYDTKPKVVQLYEINNRLAIKTFDFVSECARFLGIPQSTAAKRFKLGTQFLYEGQQVVIKK